MTRKFAADGKQIPVTVVVVEPCVVTAVKSKEKNGYAAIQLGYGHKKKLPKILAGQFKDRGSFSTIKEFKVGSADGFTVGQKLDVSIFSVGDMVKVTGISKGKGFQGVVKRHGFHGSPATHGHKDQLRMPGSIGAGGVQHVFKGLRMAGRLGGAQSTVQNLEVVEVQPDNNKLLIKGALPGHYNSLVYIVAN